MSHINAAVEAWRQNIQQQGQVSADKLAEFESNLRQSMESLQKSGLRPDECFLIASQRLGHPGQLVTESRISATLPSWRRPAKLVLWGLLLLELISLVWSIILLVTETFKLGDFLMLGHWLSPITNGILVGSFWLLAAKSQGWLGRGLTKLEAAVQCRPGSIWLIVTPVLVMTSTVLLRYWLNFLLVQDRILAGDNTAEYSTVSDIVQVLFSQLSWTIPVSILLLLVIRAEKPPAAAPLAEQSAMTC